MADESELITCEEYSTRTDEIWAEWVRNSNTEDPEAWDQAFALYVKRMVEVRAEFGHPPGKPRKRP